MEIAKIFFISSFVILFYTYFGYGMILWFITRFFPKKDFPSLTAEDLPEVTHVIAAYNEEDIIEKKILNTYRLKYPSGKIRTIIVADGSTDRTVDIIQKYPKIELYYTPERAGKLHAVDRVMKDVKTPVTVFSDANAMLEENSLRYMIHHFQSNRVGAVAGEKVVLSDKKDDASSAGEGIYWKYESALKRLDYKLYSVIGAAGELFAVRTHLYESLPSNTLIEDFVLTLKIAQKGYRIAYEPNARAMEYASSEVSEEIKRKIRISAGGLQAVWYLRSLLNPFKNKRLHYQYISHRVNRWTLAPLALLIFFLTNLMLVNTGEIIYSVILAGQIGFYVMALLGFLLERRKIQFKPFFVPFYFIFMNVSVYLGFYKLICGDYSATWEKAKRKS